MHTPSHRITFSALFALAAGVIVAGFTFDRQPLTLAGLGVMLFVLAGGVVAALPAGAAAPERAPKPAKAAARAAARDEKVATLVPLAAERQEVEFDVVPEAPRVAVVPPVEAVAPAPVVDDHAPWRPPAHVNVPWSPREATPAIPAGQPRRYAPGFEPPAMRAAAGVAVPTSAPPSGEWARAAPPPSAPAAPAPERYSPLGVGTTRGVCSKCGTHLTLSNRRPLRATCPICGHSKVLN